MDEVAVGRSGLLNVKRVFSVFEGSEIEFTKVRFLLTGERLRH